MAKMSIKNYGHGNVINQTIGNGTIYDLDISGLAKEYKHSKNIFNKKSLSRMVTSAAAIVAALIFLSICILLAWHENAFSDIHSFVNFLKGSLVGSLESIGAIILFLFTLISGALGASKISHPSEVEKRQLAHMSLVRSRAEDLGATKKGWKKALKDTSE